jgi:hypothetical protein
MKENNFFCTTINGSLNSIRAFYKDVSLPIFDRSFMQIHKMFVSLQTCLTYSINKLVTQIYNIIYITND